MKKLLFQSSVLMLLLVQPTYAETIENFDTDPGWTQFNNPANSNDFGFQNSNLAGGTAAAGPTVSTSSRMTGSTRPETTCVSTRTAKRSSSAGP